MTFIRIEPKFCGLQSQCCNHKATAAPKKPDENKSTSICNLIIIHYKSIIKPQADRLNLHD